MKVYITIQNNNKDEFIIYFVLKNIYTFVFYRSITRSFAPSNVNFTLVRLCSFFSKLLSFMMLISKDLMINSNLKYEFF